MIFFKKRAFLTLLALSQFFLACDDKSASENVVETPATLTTAQKTIYNLRDLATDEASYTFEIGNGLISGSIKEIKSEVYDVNGSRITTMETHTEFLEHASGSTYKSATLRRVNEEGNVIQTSNDGALVCTLENEVDAMPTQTRINTHSEVTRDYTCNNGSHYSSVWELLEDSDGEALYIITKVLYFDGEEKKSITSFKLNDKSQIIAIRGSAPFGEISYDYEAYLEILEE